METQEKRKTYSLAPDMSRELARHALNISEKLGKNVTRQSILDALVGSMKDKNTYNLVIKKLENDR